ncbi:hypothetical protein E2C01_018809 [Portunus trituberculatus]|uniref:Uncharacterized protein n=1 Tax=Portunus trituberculatus TaxID=210409 RepID=A0A5B7DXH7_PORTR|nr:hypothetical protein [Portunus trituberculatus]
MISESSGVSIFGICICSISLRVSGSLRRGRIIMSTRGRTVISTIGFITGLTKEESGLITRPSILYLSCPIPPSSSPSPYTTATQVNRTSTVDLMTAEIEGRPVTRPSDC